MKPPLSLSLPYLLSSVSCLPNLSTSVSHYPSFGVNEGSLALHSSFSATQGLLLDTSPWSHIKSNNAWAVQIVVPQGVLGYWSHSPRTEGKKKRWKGLIHLNERRCQCCRYSDEWEISLWSVWHHFPASAKEVMVGGDAFGYQRTSVHVS